METVDKERKSSMEHMDMETPLISGRNDHSIFSRAFELDDIIHLEEMFVDTGRQEGILDGMKAGTVEGRLMGIAKAYQLTSEVAYYYGYASMWKETFILSCSDVISVRITKAIESLLALLESWPLDNAPSIGMMELLEQIRGKWKRVQVALKDIGSTPSVTNTQLSF